MADVAGVSLQTANRYLSVLTFRGQVRCDKGAFVLAATPQGKYKCKIQAGARPTLQHIKNLLHAKILEQSGRQQAIKNTLETFITGSGRVQGNCDKQIHGDTYAPLLSVRNISNICNISVNSARNLVKDLNRANVIRTTQADAQFLCYGAPSALSHLNGLAGYRYYHNGCLCEIQPAQHRFLQHPIAYKPVTAARYKNMMKDPQLRKFAYKLKLSNIQ